jgi:hypothetical protein
VTTKVSLFLEQTQTYSKSESPRKIIFPFPASCKNRVLFEASFDFIQSSWTGLRDDLILANVCFIWLGSAFHGLGFILLWQLPFWSWRRLAFPQAGGGTFLFLQCNNASSMMSRSSPGLASKMLLSYLSPRLARKVDVMLLTTAGIKKMSMPCCSPQLAS